MSFKKQIMSKASFLHQIEDIVFITTEVFFTSYSVLKIGEDHFTFWGCVFQFWLGCIQSHETLRPIKLLHKSKSI